MEYPSRGELEPGDVWRWCNYRSDTVTFSAQPEEDQAGWRQAADLIHERGVVIERQAKEIDHQRRNVCEEADKTYAAIQERDAALAEVDGLKARLSESQDEAEAMRTTITSGEWGML